MPDYPLGQSIVRTFHFYSDAAKTVLADPATITLEDLNPDDTTTTSTLAGGQIARTSLGTFTHTSTPAASGDYRWQLTATSPDTAQFGSFTVLAEYGVEPAAFATPDQLAASLGVTVPTDETTLSMWTTALDDASGHLRTVIGQPINAGTVTLELLTNDAGEADIWLVPVTAITSIADPEGNVVTSDNYTLKDQRLYLRRALTVYTVTFAYGYTKIPAELVRWTKILAAAQIKAAPQGSLGLSNVASVAVDDGKVSYTDAPSTTLPELTAQWLKATFGGPQ